MDYGPFIDGGNTIKHGDFPVCYVSLPEGTDYTWWLSRLDCQTCWSFGVLTNQSLGQPCPTVKRLQNQHQLPRGIGTGTASVQ